MNQVVIGLGFGDEGKGLVVDWLCSQSQFVPTVVRFSGGHQVGHTVVVGKTRHVFSNFGSGTLRECPTHWSKFCTVEPIKLCEELDELKDKVPHPLLYLDNDCPITTPYDVLSNRVLEGNNKHGSVGVGFGETIERQEKHYSLTVRDLFYPKIFFSKFDAIRDYYRKKLGNSFFNDLDKDESPIDINLFAYSCGKINEQSKHIHPVDSVRKSVVYIFEGSQGLLLDKDYGFFPHVTRSNTGTKNIPELITNDMDIEFYLVTRAYQTRHGNGFTTNEGRPHNIKENPEETNIDREFQGKFRRTILDVSLLEYGMSKDKMISNTRKKSLVITCLDHVKNAWSYTYNNEFFHCKSESEFVDQIACLLNIDKVFISNSPDSSNIMRFSGR